MLLKPRHLARYKDIASLLVEHRRAALGRGDEAADAAAVRADAKRLADELEELGPTFVKLGQLLSTRSDLLPEPYLEELGRLQEGVNPFPFEDVQEIISTELGVRVSVAFSSFEETPIASASLGQVHRASLRDGRPVAVKVQRPDIRARILDDMDAIESIAEFADAHTEIGRQLGFASMVGEFRRSLLDELDYEEEANHLELLGANLERWTRIVVPQPVRDYTTRAVLTMDYVDGRTVGNLGPLGVVELDGGELAQELFGAYLDQVLVDGFFHADPHPGNLLVTEDGRLALLDVGMVARVDPEMQDDLVKLLVAVSEGHGPETARVATGMGEALEEFDAEQFRRKVTDLVARSQSVSMRELHAGALVAELTRVSGACGLRLPPELTMLGKTLLNLDEIVRTFDPDFDPNAAIREATADLLRRKLVQTTSAGSVASTAIEVKEFAEKLPRQLRQVMDALARGELTLNVKGIDEREIMRSFQKLANRVTSGLVVAALVIGAALIMRIETEAELFGYPALAIVLFLVAATAAIALLVSTQISDLPQRRRRHRWRDPTRGR
jgi:predicted unusual protein kinase regulating ubiquinone biosynthesis (AarF/ABC1/UbiB family)